MEERTTGVILRTRPLTESSLIVQWLTRDFGRISTVAKGARRPKSSFAGKLDLFYLADLSFHQSRRSDLHTLREVNVHDYRARLRLDLPALQQAAYFVQLVEQTTEANTPVPEVFELFEDAIQSVAQAPTGALTVLGFEIKLLQVLGFSLEFNSGSSTNTLAQCARSLALADWSTVQSVPMTSDQVGQLNRCLQRALTEHFGKLAKGRAPAMAAALPSGSHPPPGN